VPAPAVCPTYPFGSLRAARSRKILPGWRLVGCISHPLTTRFWPAAGARTLPKPGLSRPPIPENFSGIAFPPRRLGAALGRRPDELGLRYPDICPASARRPPPTVALLGRGRRGESVVYSCKQPRLARPPALDHDCPNLVVEDARPTWRYAKRPCQDELFTVVNNRQPDKATTVKRALKLNQVVQSLAASIESSEIEEERRY